MMILLLFFAGFVFAGPINGKRAYGYGGSGSGSIYCYPNGADPYGSGGCPYTRPYCNPDTSLCEECVTDIQCRNATNCNAVCRGTPRTCQSPNSDGSFEKCEYTKNVCYELVGQCINRCSPNDPAITPQFFPSSFCLELKQNVSNAIGNICGIADGRCNVCIKDTDCGREKNETCGSFCAYDYDTKQTQCYKVPGCSSNEKCIQDTPPNGSYFRCVDLNWTRPIPTSPSQPNTGGVLEMTHAFLFLILAFCVVM